MTDSTTPTEGEPRRWMDDPESARSKLRLIIAGRFMQETGSTWLYDKGEWLQDLLSDYADETLAALEEVHGHGWWVQDD